MVVLERVVVVVVVPKGLSYWVKGHLLKGDWNVLSHSITNCYS